MMYPRQIIYLKNVRNFFNFFNFKNSSKNFVYFSKIFSKKFNIKNVIPLSFGRFGIYLSCKEIVKNQKNEIIMSPFTIFDVVNMVICAKGNPVFCDIDKDTNHLSLRNIKKKINKKTAGIIITHYETINPEIIKIYEYCKKNKIKVINDLAISIDSKIENKNLAFFSDFSIYSFGFYKFVSSILGGGLFVKDNKIYKRLNLKVKNYSYYNLNNLVFQITKYFWIKFLLSQIVFRVLTFPLFKYAFVFNINFLLNYTKNDPDPFLRKNIDKLFFKTLNIIQIKNIEKSFKDLEKLRTIRKRNYLIYKSYLDIHNITLSYSENIQKNSSFINFPILVNNKQELTKFLMNRGFDVSQYFYRDCSSIIFFKKYGKNLSMINQHVKKLLVLPTHHLLSKKYVISLSKSIILFYEKKKNI
jgi:perosamine synthetase